MLEWLIIGGGIHGTSISHTITKRMRVPLDRVRVLDPYESPLQSWNHVTSNVSMSYLRSPGAHHLHYDPWSINTFVETSNGRAYKDFIPVYQRPSLALFNAYSAWVIEKCGLDQLRVQGRANALHRLPEGWRVETAQGSLESRRVVLAMGAMEQPRYPVWSQGLRDSGARMHHLFEPGFRRESLTDWTHAVVIGGGISAAQTALAMAAQQPGTVTMVSRHELRVFDFDSDPCWVTSICLKDFHATQDYDQRRAMIRAVRHTGSMPYDVFQALEKAVEEGMLNLKFSEVETAVLHFQSEPSRGGSQTRPTPEMQLSLSPHSETLHADLIILATGFDPKRPGGAWIDNAIIDHGLAVASDGYPIVDVSLQWAEGLYVSGPLAELEVGPTSRNIIGARLAGERIRTGHL